MPTDARRLIEGVFNPEAEIPEALQRNGLAAEGEAFADAAQAYMVSVRREIGYSRAQRGLEWAADTIAPSRLGAMPMCSLCHWGRRSGSSRTATLS